MEDAQPATAQGVAGGQSSMAPQEVYRPGDRTNPAEKGEVLLAKSGLPVARQEMSREEKTRRRRREKERIRKAGGADAARAANSGRGSRAAISKKAQMQKETVADLRKGGVKIVNRKGEVLDVDGNKARAGAAVSSSNFKL
jgi:U3 small nucleolar RNA-associated protein MPP10